MLLSYVRNTILIYIWISLFKCGILVSSSIRSKNGLRIFLSGELKYSLSHLVHNFDRNLSFVQKKASHTEYFGVEYCKNAKGFRRLQLFEKNDENNFYLEYNFPLYESRWQKFWKDSKLFATEDINVLKKNLGEFETVNVNRSSFFQNSGPLESGSPLEPISNNLHTHLGNFGKNKSNLLLEDEEVCDISNLQSGLRLSDELTSGRYGAECNDKTLGHTSRKNYMETVNDIELKETKPKYYILSMIPYPSGKGLHVGHLLGYTAVDVIARYKRLRNFNVLNPIGFDCFGIPTEIYSEKVNRTPQEVTSENVENFRKQLRSMGFTFDFSRELRTSDVEYYKWTQWIFQNMYLRGLAYRDKGYVNYCPELKSELSNEEIKHGKSVRGNYDVYKRLRTMWKLRITEYAKRLYEDLSLVDYPQRLINLQRNWIGPKQGYLIKLLVEGKGGCSSVSEDGVEPRCLYGFISDIQRCDEIESVEVPVLLENVLDYCAQDRKEEVCELLNETLKMSNVELSDERNRRRICSGMSVINPYNKNKLPIYVTNALVNTNKQINCRVNVPDSKGVGFNSTDDSNWTSDCDKLGNNGRSMAMEACSSDNAPETGFKGSNKGWEASSWYKPYLYFNIKDWEFSRNRGWGEPIPVSLKTDSGLSSTRESGNSNGYVPEEDEVKYEMRESELTNTGNGDCERYNSDLNDVGGQCDSDLECKMKMLEELPLVLNDNIKETMPQWAGSSWHYLRFVDPENNYEIFNKKIASYWLPVDLYIGGVEHAVSHLLYSRFWNKFLYDINVSPVSEPFKKIILHGVIKTVSFYVSRSVYEGLSMKIKEEIREYNIKNNLRHKASSSGSGTHVSNIDAVEPADYKLHNDIYGVDKGTGLDEVMKREEIEVPAEMVMKYRNKYVLRSDRGVEMKVRMKKMSKSRGNVISPEHIIRKYGSDALRLHLLFLGPIEKDKIWSIESISGVYRLLKLIHSFYIQCFKENMNDKGTNTPKSIDGAHNLSRMDARGAVDDKSDDDLDTTYTERSSDGVNTSCEVASDSTMDKEVALEVNKFVTNVTYNLENVKLNKISEFFIFLKLMQKWHRQRRLSSRVLDTFLITLSPFAPHLAEELWYLRHLKANSLNNADAESNKRKRSEDGNYEIDKNYRSIALEKWPEKINVL